MTSEAAVKIEKIDYKGWPNSYRISNGEVELVMTSDIGPRIMRYAFIGGQNLFKEFEETLGKSGEPAWVPRGGHRIWAAPEDPVKTYAPDNSPVKVAIKGGHLKLSGIKDSIMEVFRITKLDEVFDIYKNETAALDAFQRNA